MFEIITLLVLGTLVIAQAIERHLYAKDMTKKLNDCIKAVMSRNINEYISAVSTEATPNKGFTEIDEVNISEVDEDTFNDFIEKQTQ